MPLAANGWYYVNTENQERGPVSLAQFQEQWAAGTVNGGCSCWTEGMADWTYIDGLPELLSQLNMGSSASGAETPSLGSSPGSATAASAASAAVDDDDDDDLSSSDSEDDEDDDAASAKPVRKGSNGSPVAPASASVPVPSASGEKRASLASSPSTGSGMNKIRTGGLLDQSDFMSDLLSRLSQGGRKGSAALASPSSPQVEEQWNDEQRQKKGITRRHVIMEILASEESYLAGLENVRDLYIEKIKQSGYGIMDKASMEVVFANTLELIPLAKDFIQAITPHIRAADGPSLAFTDEFVKFAPRFQVPYLQFSTQLKASTELLNKIHLGSGGKSRKFKKLEEEALAAAGGLTLGSLLITPIQRLPRYILLLREVARNTDPQAKAEQAKLRRALEAVEAVTVAVNETIRGIEDRFTLLQMQQLFEVDISSDQENRRFLKQGPLIKVCRAKDKPFQFFLFNDLIMYGEKWSSRGVAKSGFRINKQLPINANFRVVAKESRDKAGNVYQGMEMYSEVKSFESYSHDPQISREWLEAIQAAVDDWRNANGVSLRAPAAEVKPVWAADKSSDNCLLCDRKFTFRMRRHHCRRCGLLVCGPCSKDRLPLMSGKGDKLKKKRVCVKCAAEMRASEGPDPQPGSGGSSPSSGGGPGKEHRASLLLAGRPAGFGNLVAELKAGPKAGGGDGSLSGKGTLGDKQCRKAGCKSNRQGKSAFCALHADLASQQQQQSSPPSLPKIGCSPSPPSGNQGSPKLAKPADNFLDDPAAALAAMTRLRNERLQQAAAQDQQQQSPGVPSRPARPTRP